MALKKKDFIEIEFTGKVKDGEIFDSNMGSDLKDENLKKKSKPFIFCLGQGMFLKAIDDFLVGKEVGEFEIELEPEKAFGIRNSKLVRLIPSSVFAKQNINPVRGGLFNFDGQIAKIISISGGRVVADFNNPLAGKIVQYKIRILRKVEDLNEKIGAFIEFLFRKKLDFRADDEKISITVEKPEIKFIELFSEKFKQLFERKLEVKEKN